MQTKKRKGQIPPRKGATEKIAKLFMMIVKRYAELEFKEGDDEKTRKENEKIALNFGNYHRKDFVKILKLGDYYDQKGFDIGVEQLITEWQVHGDAKVIAINLGINSATAFLDKVDLLELNKACFSLGVYVWLTKE